MARVAPIVNDRFLFSAIQTSPAYSNVTGCYPNSKKQIVIFCRNDVRGRETPSPNYDFFALVKSIKVVHTTRHMFIIFILFIGSLSSLYSLVHFLQFIYSCNIQNLLLINIIISPNEYYLSTGHLDNHKQGGCDGMILKLKN